MMRIASVVLLLVCSAYCAHLRGVANVGKNSTNLIRSLASKVGEGVSEVVHEVVPDCFFGVKSVSMILFNSDNPDGKVINVNKTFCNDFDRSKPITFLVHGFISSANSSNSYDLATALVEKGQNVFSLDWSDAACTNGLPVVKLTGYPSAVNNTREIGHFMADYVISLLTNCTIPLEKISFIGHSLGAHVSGFASKRIQKLGYGLIPRLIAADPAKPLFLTNKCEDRVCISDAEDVTVLHTSGLGIPYSLGYTDLYFGDAYVQPGCSVDVPCSHSRSTTYLTEVLKNTGCKFPGVPMSPPTVLSTIAKVFQRNPTYPNSADTDCIVMDDRIFTSNYLKEGSYHTFVQEEEPFCTMQDFSCE